MHTTDDDDANLECVEVSHGISLDQLQTLLEEYEKLGRVPVTRYAKPDWEEWMLYRKMPFTVSHEMAHEMLKFAKLEIAKMSEKQAQEYGEIHIQREGHPQKQVGAALARITALVLGQRQYKRMVEPHILDMRYEHGEALKAGAKARARYIVMRGYIQVLWPVLYGVATALGALWKIAK